MNKTIGILAHVDGGKTTLSEQLLYQSGQVRTLGKVDDASSRLDEDEMERRRGITIFSHSAWFSYGGDRYYLLDTPGHTDFFGQTERCLWALDLAVLVVSIPEGIRGHTLTLWRLLRQQNIPTILFLNKADQPAPTQKPCWPGSRSGSASIWWPWTALTEPFLPLSRRSWQGWMKPSATPFWRGSKTLPSGFPRPGHCLDREAGFPSSPAAPCREKG